MSKESTIGRNTAPSNQHECFFPRLLLVIVRGPTPIQHMRIVNEVTHALSAVHAKLRIDWRTTDAGIVALMTRPTCHIQAKFVQCLQ